MKWIAISGSWRQCSPKVEKDVRRDVRELERAGDGIISGGALGVDYVATDEMMRYNPNAKRIKTFLPSTLERYVKHYRKRAREGIVTTKQAENLIAQLMELKRRNPSALVEHPTNMPLAKDAYYERNTAIVAAADSLLAYHVNASEGTGDTISKAKTRGIPVTVRTYTVPD